MRRLLIVLAALGVLAAAGVLVWLPFRGHSKAAAPKRRTRTIRVVVKKTLEPLPPPTGPHDASVPILMYHVIAPPPPNAPYPGLYVKPADFGGQVTWLAAHGYQAVTLRRVYDFWAGKRTRVPLGVIP